METIDSTRAAQVWQRVQGKAQPKEQGLLAMIAGEWTDATTYLLLSRHFQGKAGAALRKMYEEEQAHTACLKGIYTLITGTRPSVKATPPSSGDPESILRCCYGREMQCLVQYEARASDSEYGPVFTRLAAQEREHCRTILELIGNLKKK